MGGLRTTSFRTTKLEHWLILIGTIEKLIVTITANGDSEARLLQWWDSVRDSEKPVW